jgi:ceramide glucosyltransferase
MAKGSMLLLIASSLGLTLYLVQLLALAWHRRKRQRARGPRPPISILRPLCGIDDDLPTLLDEIAVLDYPEYEVLLGVRDPRDPAYLVAVAAARRHERLRVVLQRDERGANPKVNQLITLARTAHHDLLVVSDSNVRLPPGYLDEIADHLADPQVGLVTHPVIGVGARCAGARLDNLHMSSSIGPGMVGAQRVSGKDLVVGKSMAMWRHNLVALGGFESVRDVLAEDYVIGQKVGQRLGKRVVMARSPVWNVVRDRSVAGFVDRYARWAVLHRTCVGLPLYCAQLLLNPSLLATAALLLSPSMTTLWAALNILVLRALLDGASALVLGRSFSLFELMHTPLRDACLAIAWWRGLRSNRVVWRGNALRVGPGSRLLRPLSPSLPVVRPLPRFDRARTSAAA